MKKLIRWLFFLSLLSPLLAVKTTYACGHEGWYVGLGYTQLFQYSLDNRLVGAGGAANKVDFDPRYGGHFRVGKDVCGSRWGGEVPISWDRQQLNEREVVNQFSFDANAVYHIIETAGGIDFYAIAGTGLNFLLEGPVNNNTGAAGVNFNAGPGFNYFFKRDDPKIAIALAVPVKYTLYFGNNLSGSNKTSVVGFPVRIGLSVGFK